MTDEERRLRKNARKREYRRTHKELIAERERIYRREHREQRAEYNRRWRLEHKEQQKQYRQDNKEKIKEYQKQYRSGEKEDIFTDSVLPMEFKDFTQKQIKEAEKFSEKMNNDLRAGRHSVLPEDFYKMWE